MLFISHSTQDKGVARALKHFLLQRGYREQQVFIDSEPVGGIPPGARWENVIYRSLSVCRAMIVLCSPRWSTSKWCFAELAAAKMRGKLLFPLVIEECDHKELSEYQALLARQPGEQTTAFEWLAAQLERQGVGPSDIGLWPHPELSDAHGRPDRCPFPGLSAFDERYEAVYFGREHERDELLEQLQRMRNRGEPRLLMITGGSGSGKSSLMKAGVLPRLVHRSALNNWFVFRTLRFGQRATPGALFESLAFELHARNSANADAHRACLPDFAELCERFAGEEGDRAFVEATRSLIAASGAADPTVLLPIDQFEELLAAASNAPQPSGGSARAQRESAADPFLRFLQRLCSSSDTRVLVIGTMRSDYLDIYEQHTYALRAPQFSAWRLEPFSREQVEHIVVSPAERAGIEIEAELIERLKLDTQESEARSIDALPLLAFTLESLYRRCADKGKIEQDDYRTIGGLEGAIRRAAENILPANSDLPSEVIAAVRLCFSKHLVQINDKGEFVRRVALWKDVIADIPTAVAARTAEILERFVEARLLTKTTAANEDAGLEATRGVTLEVTHEALYRCWPPLQVWLNESARVLRWRRDVGRDQQSAALNQQPWSGLKSEQLAISRDWPKTRRAELSAGEVVWIEQAARRANWTKIGATLVTLLVAALALLSVWNARQATYESEVARSQNLAGESRRFLNSNPQLAALLAVGADDVRPTVESHGAMLQFVHGQRRPELIETPVSTAFAVSPRQAIFATGHADGTVQIRTIERGAPRILQGSTATVSQLTFDASGTYLAVAHHVPGAGESGDVLEVWNTALATRVGRSIAVGGAISWMGVLREGHAVVTLASVARGREVLRIWSLDTGEPLAGPKHVAARIAALSPDGKVIGVVAAGDGYRSAEYILHLSALDLSLVHTGPTLSADASSATTAAFDGTGAWYITGHEDGTIRFSSAPRAEPAVPSVSDEQTPKKAVLSGHGAAVTSLALHAGGKILASGSKDGTIRLWHLEARQALVPPDKPRYMGGSGFDSFTGTLVSSTELTSPDPHGEPVLFSFQPEDTVYNWDSREMSVGFSADGRQLLAASSSDAIQRWILPVGKPVINYRRRPGGADVSVEAKLFVRADGFTASVRALDDSPRATANLGEYVSRVMLDRHGKTVLVVGSVSAQLFDAHSGKPVSSVLWSGVHHALSPDGTRLAIAGTDRTIRLFDAGGALTGTVSRDILSSTPTALIFSPDSTHLFVGDSRGTLQRVAIPSGKDAGRFQHIGSGPSVMAVDASGRWLAVADEQNNVRIWDTRTRQRVGPVMSGGVDNGIVLSLRFSHDGTKLALGTEKLHVRLLDVQSGKQIGPDIQTMQAAEAVAFTADDAELLVITNDFAPRTLAISPQRLRPMIAGLTGRNASWAEWERYFAPKPYRRTFADYGVHESYLEAAARLAIEGQTSGALAMYRHAANLQPDLNLDATAAVDRIRLAIRGEALARAGDTAGAVECFDKAQTLGWRFHKDIHAYANELAIDALTAEGVRLAELDEVEQATTLLEKALRAINEQRSEASDGDSRGGQLIKMGASGYARHIALRSLLAAAEDQANLGRVEDAAEKFRAAGKYDESYSIDPLGRAKTMAIASLKQQGGEWLARQKLDRARDLYARVHRIDPSFDADREYRRVLAGIKRSSVESKAQWQGLDAALQLIEEAQALDPQSPQDLAQAKMKARVIAHRANADRLAEKGQQSEALAEYTAALALDPSLQLDPAREFRHRRMSSIRSQASDFLANGDRVAALDSLQSLLELDRKLSIDHELIVLTVPSSEVRDKLREYLGEKRKKAFVLTPMGAWQWATEYSTTEEAVAAALEGVRKRAGGETAFVYMKDDTVVAPSEDLIALRQMLRSATRERPILAAPEFDR